MKRLDLILTAIGAALLGILIGIVLERAQGVVNPTPGSGGREAERTDDFRREPSESVRDRRRGDDKQQLLMSLCKAVEDARVIEMGAGLDVQVKVIPRHVEELLPDVNSPRFALSLDVEYSESDEQTADRYGAFAILRKTSDGWEVEHFDQMYARQ